ncbi:MAG: hypothetical protein KGY46_05040 [Anaerolineales bacterium]|nr:hypothetical protein [Anaerolineales bacterium]
MIHKSDFEKRKKIRKFFVFFFLILFAIIVIYLGLATLPLDKTSIAIDWKGIWLGLEDGKIRYGTGIRNPPWSLIPLVPLGLLPFFESWVLLSLVTLMALMISIPKVINKQKFLLGALLLTTSYPSIRHLVDGNLEALIILGVLMLLLGYSSHNPLILAFGFLLASAKPQETWILLLALFINVLSFWKIKDLIICFAVVFSVVIPTMLMYGVEWLNSFVGIPQMGSIMDSSLITSMRRLGLPYWWTLLIWFFIFAPTLYLSFEKRERFSRIHTAFFISASLLLSPYAAANSLLTIVALGVIPLLFEHPIVGCFLIAIINLPYTFSSSFKYEWAATYGMLMFLLCWFIFGTYISIKKSKNVPKQASS